MKYDDISLEDLQEQHRGVAEVIGIKNMVELSKVYGGISFNIPKLDNLFKNKKYRAICEEFNGTNIKALALKYQVSESTVYRLVRNRIVKGGPQIPGQCEITDYL